MLIDDFMPDYDFSEKHDTEIVAPPAQIFETMKSVDICESAVFRWLFRLRGLRTKGFTLDKIADANFIELAQRKNKELVLGLIGKFWTPTGHLQRFDPADFAAFDQKEFAKATWNFSLDEIGAGKTLLATETRIRVPDDSNRSKFRIYWTFVRPFSGLVRMEMLKIVKNKAEGI